PPRPASALAPGRRRPACRHDPPAHQQHRRRQDDAGRGRGPRGDLDGPGGDADQGAGEPRGHQHRPARPVAARPGRVVAHRRRDADPRQVVARQRAGGPSPAHLGHHQRTGDHGDDRDPHGRRRYPNGAAPTADVLDTSCARRHRPHVGSAPGGAPSRCRGDRMVTNETAGRHVAGGPRITRRRLLAYAAATPPPSVVVKLAAVVGPGGAPPAGAQVAGIVDFTDALTLAAAPTQHLLVVEVTAENRVVARLPRAEVGQGITTAVAQIVADEIGARLEDTDVVLEDARPELLWNQLTGGSNTVHALYTPLRVAAAGARARLITAAARRWGVSASGLVTADTTVTGPGGRSATFGELSAAAASVTVPAVPAVPKDPSQHTLIGQPTTRIDARDIVTGKARYTQDLPIPDALTCVVARPPTLGGTVRSVDDRAARAVPGVVDVVRIPTGVAVVAETFDQALAGRDALVVDWNPGPAAHLSDADVRSRLRGAVLPYLPAPGMRVVEHAFDFAFVPHAPMEVLNCVADVRSDRA